MTAVIKSKSLGDLVEARNVDSVPSSTDLGEVEQIAFSSLNERDAYSDAIRQLVGRSVVVSAQETHRLTDKGSIHAISAGRAVLDQEVEVIEVMGMLGSYVHYQVDGERRTSFVYRFVAKEVLELVRSEATDGAAPLEYKSQNLDKDKPKSGIFKSFRGRR